MQGKLHKLYKILRTKTFFNFQDVLLQLINFSNCTKLIKEDIKNFYQTEAQLLTENIKNLQNSEQEKIHKKIKIKEENYDSPIIEITEKIVKNGDKAKIEKM